MKKRKIQKSIFCKEHDIICLDSRTFNGRLPLHFESLKWFYIVSKLHEQGETHNENNI